MDITHIENLSDSPIKSFCFEIIRHEKLGDGVIRTICRIEGIEAVRIEQVIYGAVVGDLATWRVKDSIITNGSDLLENVYLIASKNKVIPTFDCSQ